MYRSFSLEKLYVRYVMVCWYEKHWFKCSIYHDNNRTRPQALLGFHVFFCSKCPQLLGAVCIHWLTRSPTTWMQTNALSNLQKTCTVHYSSLQPLSSQIGSTLVITISFFGKNIKTQIFLLYLHIHVFVCKSLYAFFYVVNILPLTFCAASFCADSR